MSSSIDDSNLAPPSYADSTACSQFQNACVDNSHMGERCHIKCKEVRCRDETGAVAPLSRCAATGEITRSERTLSDSITVSPPSAPDDSMLVLEPDERATVCPSELDTASDPSGLTTTREVPALSRSSNEPATPPASRSD